MIIGVLSSAARHVRKVKFSVSPMKIKEGYVSWALGNFDNSVYLEIGVRRGDSMRMVSASRKIGVDPAPDLRLYPLRRGEEVFKVDSDEFFRTQAHSAIELNSIHCALVDGYHSFEQVFRDVSNLAPFMHRHGLIVLDDMNPQTSQQASPRPTGGVWSGDVWKFGPYVREACPQMSFKTVNVDAGVGLLGGFGNDASWPDASPAVAALAYQDLEADREELLRLVEVLDETALNRMVGLP